MELEFFHPEWTASKNSHLKEGWFVVGIVLSTLNITKIHVDDSGRYCIANKSHCKPLPLPAKEKRGTPFGRDYVSSQKGTWLVFICSYISYILIFLPWKQPSWFRILFAKHQRISSSQPRFSYPTQAELPGTRGTRFPRSATIQEMQLNNLVPGEIYNISVSAVSAAGIGPLTSELVAR